MLLEFALIVTPGAGLIFFIVRFIKANATVTVSRTNALHAEARMEDARETAREAMGQVTDAIAVAKTIGIVDAKIDYIVAAINGEAHPARRAQVGRHKRELPSGE